MEKITISAVRGTSAAPITQERGGPYVGYHERNFVSFTTMGNHFMYMESAYEAVAAQERWFIWSPTASSLQKRRAASYLLQASIQNHHNKPLR